MVQFFEIAYGVSKTILEYVRTCSVAENQKSSNAAQLRRIKHLEVLRTVIYLLFLIMRFFVPQRLLLPHSWSVCASIENSFAQHLLNVMEICWIEMI